MYSFKYVLKKFHKLKNKLYKNILCEWSFKLNYIILIKYNFFILFCHTPKVQHCPRVVDTSTARKCIYYYNQSHI